MKLTITTNPKEVEKVNYLLAQAISSLRDNPRLLKTMSLTESDLDKCEKFRKSLLDEFLTINP